MEDILAKIMKDASTNKHANIKKSCLESQELLACQHGLMRSPPYELRSKILETLCLALESKHNKLISHALSGFQRLIWDKSFQSAYEIDNEENWIPIQLMNAVASLNSLSDDVQVEILKILLNMTTTHGQSLTSRSIIMLVTLCCDAYSNNSSGVRTAAQVTINQTLTSFCIMLQEIDPAFEDQADDSDAENGFNLLESITEELYPVLHCTCEKLKNVDCNKSRNGSPLLLQCILSVLKNIKLEIHESTELLNFLWQELCPLLVALLGSPKTDKNIISSQKSCDVSEIGRGSGCLAAAPSCLSSEAKTVYSIAVELVRLVGSVGSLRPVLESLFHRMLLYPPVQHRLEALKAIKELFSKTELLLQFAAPPLYVTSDKDWISLDLDLIKIAIDSLGECCHSSDNNVCYASVSCILALLKSLEEICGGDSIKQELVLCINSQFRTLESSDYKGAKSERWLKTKLRSLLEDKDKRDSLKSKMTMPSKLSGDKSEEELSDDFLDSPSHKFEDKSHLSFVSEKFHQEEECKAEIEESSSNKSEDITKNCNLITEQDNSALTEIKTPSVGDREQPMKSAVESEVSEETSNHDEIHYKSDFNEIEIQIDQLETENHPRVTSPEVEITPEKSAESDDISLSSEFSPEKLKSEIINSVECKQDPPSDLILSNGNNNNLDELQAQDIVSPVTESAEDALNYIESRSSDDLSDEFDGDGDINDETLEDDDRLKRIPRTLLGQEDAGKEERERVEKLCLARLEFAQRERQNAQHFVEVLQSFLPKLLAIRSSIEADQALQEFASKYCEDLWQSQQMTKRDQADKEEITSHITILNADGIYLALYSALLLNLKLIRNNYYKEMSDDIPLTEQQFIEEVHGSGVLVYLSATWLAELYQQVLASNLLEKAGYKPVSLENSALVNLLSGLLFGTDDWWNNNLSDIDGLGESLPGMQQLADYRRLEKAVVNNQSSPKIESGRKFCRRILTCCWDTVLEVLSVLLNGTNSCGISSTIGFLLGMEGAKEEHRRTKDAIAESLDGLQRAAKLCNTLGLQSCCSAVFSQLAMASCPLAEDVLFPQLSSKLDGRQFKKSLLPGRNKALRLHSSQILSMDVLLSKGLELGSHSPDCWKYVFQCCLFVLQLENTYFSGHGSIQSSSARSVLHSSTQDSQLMDLSSCDYSVTSMPGSIPRKLDISEIIKENRSFTHSSDVLKDHKLLEAIEALSQQVDRLFEEAASRLNLSALISFLVELCAASQIQLFTQSYGKLSFSSGHGSNLLLFHLGDVMLRCARGGRPLVHVMKAWSVVAPHFVEASCHKDSLISKKGVSTIHDIVSALLSSNIELPHFHFNEALFKPFENLLCLELCDIDVQEQIVSSICEFVEGCTTEIRSGWRPLFGALRTVQIPAVLSNQHISSIERDRIHHLRVVLDVFEAFLATDNVFVFAYAAVDCLLCLLKHVKGPTALEDESLDVTIDIVNEPTVPLDMCLAALKYLEKCSDILSSMYQIPTCPVFNSAHRIQLYSGPNLVDPVILDMEIIYFEDPDSASCDSKRINFDQGNSNMADTTLFGDVPGINDIPVFLQSMEKHTGIIHVWFLLLEGLAGTLATCPKQYQSSTMESLFNMLRNLKDVPGPEFGIYCVNHLLLPMLQQWLRRTTKLYRGWENFATNFKQCCGLATDLIVDYIQTITELPAERVRKSGALLMMHQLFLVLTECVSQQMELISRLGCACLRHTVVSAGDYLTTEMWDLLCLHLKRACQVSLHSVKQLMSCFHVDSDNFYGDIGEVKVAARRDCTTQESERLRQLSHQVFLLDCQQSSLIVKPNCMEDDERTFTFLLFPPGHTPNDPDTAVIRVPFCGLIVGLLSHQILLQTIGSILLQGTKYMLPTLMALLPSESCTSNLANEKKKPGFLSKLTNKQLKILFATLEDAYETACSYDMRPGLKFLVQKVAQTNVATNLYKQAGVSWTIQMVVLFELCMSVSNLNLEFVKGRLSFESLKDTENETENNIASSDVSICEFVMLKEKFKEICESYTELTIDKEGLPNIVDRMSDMPIFFLATPADEMSDILFPSKQNDTQGSQVDSSAEHSLPIYYDSSDDEELTCAKDKEKDKIYTLASEQTINSLVTEYKKRKNQHSMPSKLKEKLYRKSSSSNKLRLSSDDSVPEEILMQRRNSIMKDGEAQLQVFKQLIQSFLDLHQSLSDEHFQAFLPVFFPGVQFLVAYATDGELRLSISEWLQRLAVCCNFFVDPKGLK